MPNEDQLMEQRVERLLATDKPHLLAAARRARQEWRKDPHWDETRDQMIDRVETYMFNDLDWEPIPATVISDVAWEIADEVLLGG
jgi:hypothetical protein